MEHKALAHFRNPYNCAQAVLKAFQDVHAIPDQHIEDMASCGGGRAEGGTCGALHAAQQLIKDEVMRQKLNESFLQEAGALTCHEVRSLKKLSCADCVQTAARIVATLNPPADR